MCHCSRHRPAVLARPQYLAKFQADPYRRVEVDGCGTCHVNPDGGGARNDFGTAFQASGTDITPLLRAAFPRQFTFESVKLPDGVFLYFSDPQGKVVVVERDKQRSAVSLAEITAPKVAPLPPAANRMSFFVTSKGFSSAKSIAGLAGADPRERRGPEALSKTGIGPLWAAVDARWPERTWYPPAGVTEEKTTPLELLQALLARGANPNARLAGKP